MKINLHKNAKTTPAQRAFIQENAQMRVSDLAFRIGVSETTVRRWKSRTSVLDKPHTPEKITTSLTPEQELLAVLLRVCLRLSLDDLLHTVRKFIFPGCSRSSLNRCLKRYHIPRLNSFQQGLPFSLNDYQGTYLFYTRILFPRLSFMNNAFSAHILLDCSFRCLYADIYDHFLHPPLFFLRNGIQHNPLTVLGIIFTDPIILYNSDTNHNVLNSQHNSPIQNLCKEHDLQSHYLKIISEETMQKLRQTSTVLKKTNKGPDSRAFKSNYIKFMRAIWIYNTQLKLGALKWKTPKLALEKHYVSFPGSFKSKPGNSFKDSKISV